MFKLQKIGSKYWNGVDFVSSFEEAKVMTEGEARELWDACGEECALFYATQPQGNNNRLGDSDDWFGCNEDL